MQHYHLISKHLMLLFNLGFIKQDTTIVSFQNISCYCLTIQCHLLNASKWISKHLMLLFNFHQSFVPVVPLHISKHLMLLFNLNSSDDFTDTIKFQNISCYCLTLFINLPHDLSFDFKTSHVIV